MLGIGFWAASASGGAAGAYELISTTVLGSSQSSVTFSSIVGTYKHIQIRIVAKGAFGSSLDNVNAQFNGDTAYNYYNHRLYGNGSSVASQGASTDRPVLGDIAGSSDTSVFGAAVIDILDYASTSKNKTIRSLSGSAGSSNMVALRSNLWISTSAITQITMSNATLGGFLTGSRFSLYGIKG